MIELVFVVCLSLTPTVCENKGMQFSDGTRSGCMQRALPHLAHWAGEHPGWKIRRWACEPIGPGQDA